MPLGSGKKKDQLDVDQLDTWTFILALTIQCYKYSLKKKYKLYKVTVLTTYEVI